MTSKCGTMLSPLICLWAVKTKMLEAPKMAEGLCVEKLLGLAHYVTFSMEFIFKEVTSDSAMAKGK